MGLEDARFLLDECISAKWAAPLRDKPGLDIFSLQGIAGIEAKGMSDRRLLELGHETGRAVITTNVVHFYHEHAMWLSAGRDPHPGIVLGEQKKYQQFAPFRSALLDLIAHRSTGDLVGNILWL